MKADEPTKQQLEWVVNSRKWEHVLNHREPRSGREDRLDDPFDGEPAPLASEEQLGKLFESFDAALQKGLEAGERILAKRRLREAAPSASK